MRTRSMPPTTKGFTLVELLVVLVILGALVGVAVLSAGITGPSRTLNNEAQKLAALIAVLSEEAQLSRREYGLVIGPNHYQVVYLADGEWVVEGKQQKLPEPIRFSGAIPLAEVIEPQILMYSTGELEPFELSLSLDAKQGFRLSSDGFSLPHAEAFN